METVQADGLHHITLVGADKETSMVFWGRVMGFAFVFEQPNLDDPQENHLYFEPGDGRMITIFTDETRKPTGKGVPRVPGAVHHVAFNLSSDAFGLAIDRLEAHGISHSGIKDRGFMHSIYFRDPLGLTIELATYVFQPPTGIAHSTVLKRAFEIRREAVDFAIEQKHLDQAIRELS